MSAVPPAFSHVHLLHCTRSSAPPPTFFQSLPSAWRVLVVQRGRLTFFAGSSSYTVASGDALLIAPHLCHAYFPESADTQLLCLSFSVDAAGPQDAPNCFLFSYRSQSLIPSLVQFIQDPGLLCDAKDKILESLLLMLNTLPYLPLTPLPNTFASQILVYLNEHFQEELSLSDLSAAFHVTPSHIIHVFKPLFDLSPIHYLNQRRIGEAQYLLQTTDSSAGDIAGLVGIPNRNYFYSTFKRLVGMTPTSYRALARQ